jgi:hypothetical protein
MTYWMALVVLVYAFTSGAVAVATLNKCDDQRLERHWQIIPPSWDCQIKRTTFRH